MDRWESSHRSFVSSLHSILEKRFPMLQPIDTNIENQEDSKIKKGLTLANAMVKGYMKNKLLVGLSPLDQILTDTLTDITTTIGTFVVRKLQGKMQRSITFTAGYGSLFSYWMEEALYGVLYQYNDLKKASRLSLASHNTDKDGSSVYFELDEGIHYLKYRKWNIILNIEYLRAGNINIRGTTSKTRQYTIICFDLDPEFPKLFEQDMIAHRNSILKINADSPTINVYRDYPEGEYTYWGKMPSIAKRKMNTIYLPKESKQLLVKTINKFFSNREYYRKHGIAHNLKILLYGPPGPQPYDTMTPTPLGLRRFGDLKVGDYVFNRCGCPVQVQEIYHKGKQALYELVLEDGRTVKCSGSHLWAVKINSICPLMASVEPTQLLYTLLQKNPEVKIYLPINEKIVSFGQRNQKDPTISPALFGFYACAGTVAKSGTISFQNIKRSSVSAVYEAFQNPNLILEMLPASNPSQDTCNVEIYGKDHEILDPLEVFASYPEFAEQPLSERMLPEDVLYATSNYRQGVQEAMMDVMHSEEQRIDWNDKQSDVLQGTNKVLLEQLVWIIRSLGDSATNPILAEKQKDSTTTMYEVETITNTSGINPSYDRYVRIQEIRKLDQEEEMMCIRVDDPEHLYLTTDFIVTHNTGKDSIARMIASEWNRNLYYVTGGKNGTSIPDAITDSSDEINSPLFLISDIDKYPFLINEPDVNLQTETSKNDQMQYKRTFGNMINALDGVMSGEDRIIVMTTNHIEKFSDTFLRPGRIDLKMNVDYLTPDVFRRYVYDFYGRILPKDIKLRSSTLTVAELQRDVVFMELSAEEFIAKYTK